MARNGSRSRCPCPLPVVAWATCSKKTPAPRSSRFPALAPSTSSSSGTHPGARTGCRTPPGSNSECSDRARPEPDRTIAAPALPHQRTECDLVTDNGVPESSPHYFRDPSDIPVELETPTGTAGDTRNRPLRDLRISVTDRCNFRCVYCMPKEIFGKDFTFMQRDELLTFEEITRVARIAVSFPVARVLRGIEVAHEVGLGPIKVNMVVKRGRNDEDIVAMARHFKGSPYILRFIEFMDVGSTNGWKMGEVVPSTEVISAINAELPLEEVAPNYDGETSVRWCYRDGSGEIGVISSVTQSFCQSCTRVRVSTEGKLFTCLFATGGHDLRALMRGGCSDEQLSTVMAHIWRERTDRYSDLRSAATNDLRGTGKKKIEMSYIGG